MNNDKILELLKKLKALADKGIDGERVNAELKLHQLAEKHGIDLSLLDDDAVRNHTFRVKKSQKKFFEQIIANVLNSRSWMSYYGEGRYEIDCTDSQAIEIQAKFDFYWREYEKDLNIFYKAFIHKNRLYISVDSDSSDDSEPTLEEKQEALKIEFMMAGLERKRFHKQLSHNNE